MLALVCQFPSPQVGSEPTAISKRATSPVVFPSPQVGSEPIQFSLKLVTYHLFPSPQVGSEQSTLRSKSKRKEQFPSPQVGSEHTPRAMAFFCRHVSIPSSRVGTHAECIVAQVLLPCFHPLKSGRNQVIQDDGFDVFAFPSPQVGSEPGRNGGSVACHLVSIPSSRVGTR